MITSKESTKKSKSTSVSYIDYDPASLYRNYILHNVLRVEEADKQNIMAATSAEVGSSVVLVSSAEHFNYAIWSFNETALLNMYHIKNVRSGLYLSVDADYSISIAEETFSWKLSFDYLNDMLQIKTTDGELAIAAGASNRLIMVDATTEKRIKDRKWKYVVATK